MKVLLFDIENQINKELVSEAHEVIMMTREYDIQRFERDKYHFLSRQPDYHVEITLKDDGMAHARCHCLPYKKSGKCKHVIAALLLLRDDLKQDRKTYKKQSRQTLDEVLQKLNLSELRTFIANYAISHSALRAEILSNYLYRTRRPDYHSLFSDLAPIDKYGQIRVNRNQIKSVRAVSSNLLKRAQQLLMDKSISEALFIIEASVLHLHKLHAKIPQFQDQLMVELKFAYRLFELLCSQSMAPRLQHRVTLLALEVCSRESYIFPAGMRPLISITENFFLEEKTRKEAFAIAEQKILTSSSQTLKWIALIYHWKRIWSMKGSQPAIKRHMETSLPDVIREFAQHGDYEDALFAGSLADKSKYDPASRLMILQASLRSARALGEKEKTIAFAYELVLQHLDTESWELLYELEPPRAVHALKVIEELYAPGSEDKADLLLLNGWSKSGNGSSMIMRLKSINDIQLLMQYDYFLKEKYRNELEGLYAKYILATREAYGGEMARQKLNNIFNHLKTNELHTSVAEKIKHMEKEKQGSGENQKIKGFVFDLDGVIVDTAVHHFQAWKKILKELGADITEEDDHHTRGAGRMESLDYLLNRYRIELSDEDKMYWASRKNDAYLEAIETITPSDLLPGALAFLKESRKLGLLIALGSASKNAATVLQKLGIASSFDAIVDGNDTRNSKPDPEIFIKACAALGLDPSVVVVFEDAPKGIQAALSAGCKAVGIGDMANLSAAHFVVPGLNHFTPSEIIARLT